MSSIPPRPWIELLERVLFSRKRRKEWLGALQRCTLGSFRIYSLDCLSIFASAAQIMLLFASIWGSSFLVIQLSMLTQRVVVGGRKIASIISCFSHSAFSFINLVGKECFWDISRLNEAVIKADDLYAKDAPYCRTGWRQDVIWKKVCWLHLLFNGLSFPESKARSYFHTNAF
jgi:hypothetical protein